MLLRMRAEIDSDALRRRAKSARLLRMRSREFEPIGFMESIY
jgi:hypothetical protein